MTQPDTLQSAAPAVGATAVPTTENLSEAQYETRHREVRQALEATPSAAAFPSVAFQDFLAFHHRTAHPVDAALTAARKMLLFGHHFGECQLGEDGRCVLHLKALAAREAALTRALATLDEAATRG